MATIRKGNCRAEGAVKIVERTENRRTTQKKWAKKKGQNKGGVIEKKVENSKSNCPREGKRGGRQTKLFYQGTTRKGLKRWGMSSAKLPYCRKEKKEEKAGGPTEVTKKPRK